MREQIIESVEEIKRRYDETDPFRLCAAMGILILYQPFGKEENSIKGFFLECCRIRTITLNADLRGTDDERVILAHEMGHAVLHSEKGLHAYRDSSPLDDTRKLESEANLFAAELLLDDDDVLDALSDYGYYGAASSLRVPYQLLGFKLSAMRQKGLNVPAPPELPQGNFLKDTAVGYRDDDWS